MCTCPRYVVCCLFDRLCLSTSESLGWVKVCNGIRFFLKKTCIYLGRFKYFTNLGFPEIRGFPLLHHHLGWGRVRSLQFDQIYKSDSALSVWRYIDVQTRRYTTIDVYIDRSYTLLICIPYILFNVSSLHRQIHSYTSLYIRMIMDARGCNETPSLNLTAKHRTWK